MNRPNKITKVLSPNDIGETGGHQSGILVPRNSEALYFFPDLGNETKNPRMELNFQDPEENIWRLNFIYYNNRFFSEKGTRNEYRLTGMTKYFRKNELKSGDSIILSRQNENYYIDCQKQEANTVKKGSSGIVRLTLSNKWKVIRY